MTESEHTAPAKVNSKWTWGTILQRGLFFALLLIVGVRPIVQETHDSQLQPFTLSLFYDYGPLPTLWINLAIAGIFGITLALRFLGHLPRPRKTGLATGYVVLAVAAVASCFIAGQKRLAINATVDWLTLPLLAMTLAWLLQQAWQMRLTLAVIIASGTASVVHSYDQFFLSLPDTLELYEQQKETLRMQEPQSYQQELFERRLRERAAPAFFSMGNVAGSYYVLTFFAALSAALALRRNRPLALLNVVVSLFILAALLMTKSRGAMLALPAGVMLILIAAVWGRAINAQRRRAFLFGWIFVLGLLAGVTAYGGLRDRLPGASLTFRWWYLQTTAKMVSDHPVIGVGSEQYGRHYPKYKEIKSPEEIANPHNFLAHAAAEWGLIGLAGMLLMLWGGSRVAAGLEGHEPDRPDENSPFPLILIWGVAAMSGIFCLRIMIESSSDLAYVYWTNVTSGMGWWLGFLLAAPAACTRNNTTSPLAPHTVVAAGLFAFLLHNLITFAFFVPGSATTFFAMFAVCAAMRNKQSPPQRPPPQKVRAYGAITATIIAALLLHQLVITPVSNARTHLQRARREADVFNAEADYNAAAREDPLDPVPYRELAQRFLEMPDPGAPVLERLTEAQHYLKAAEARDPHHIAIKRLQAQAFMLESELRTSGAALDALARASHYARRVLDLYPTNPDDHIRMARIQSRIYELTRDPQSRERAIEALARALELDRARPGGAEEVRKFPPEKVADLQRRLQQLRSAEP